MKAMTYKIKYDCETTHAGSQVSYDLMKTRLLESEAEAEE